MREIIYHVATTLDGYIARPNGLVPGFTNDGAHVDDYRASLADYGSIVMGRGTYESGYSYGMKPATSRMVTDRTSFFQRRSRYRGTKTCR